MITKIYLLYFIRAVVTERNGKGFGNTDVCSWNEIYVLLAVEYQWTWYFCCARTPVWFIGHIYRWILFSTAAGTWEHGHEEHPNSYLEYSDSKPHKVIRRRIQNGSRRFLWYQWSWFFSFCFRRAEDMMMICAVYLLFIQYQRRWFSSCLLPGAVDTNEDGSIWTGIHILSVPI